MDFRRAVIIGTVKYVEESPDFRDEFLPKVSQLIAMDYQGHLISQAVMEPNRGKPRATKANFLPEVHPQSTFMSSSACVMISRLIGKGYWIVAWRLPLDLAASGIAVPRPKCFELSKSNYIRKLIKLDPTTDCDPIPLPYVLHQLTNGSIELRAEMFLGE